MVIRTRRVEGAQTEHTLCAAHHPPTRAPSKLQGSHTLSPCSNSYRHHPRSTAALERAQTPPPRVQRLRNARRAATRRLAPSPRLLVVPASCIHQRQGDGGSFSLHAPAPSDVVVVRLRLGLNGRDGGRRGGGGGGRAIGRQPRRRRALAVEHQRHHAANERKGQRSQGDH